MQPANYSPLSNKLYEIAYAKLLYKVPNIDLWYDGGDLDSFNLNMGIQRKQRYAKDGAESYLAIEKTTRVDPQITSKFMQKTNFVRAASLAGVPVSVNQAAGNFSADVGNLVAGGFYAIGAYGISAPVVHYATDAQGTMAIMAPTFYRLVDPALGVIQVTRMPPDAYIDPVTGYGHGNVGGTVTQDDAAAATQIDIGTSADLEMEIMVRGLSNTGQKGVLHVFQWNAASEGEIGFITSNDDFDGVTIKGRAVKTDRGYGYWRSLGA